MKKPESLANEVVDNLVSIFSLARVQKFAFNIDLGQVIGKIDSVLDSIRIRNFHTDTKKALLSFYAKKIKFNSVGRLILDGSMETPWFLVYQKSNDDFRALANAANNGDFIVALLSKIGLANVLLEYNFEKIGLVDLTQMSIIVRDFWKDLNLSAEQGSFEIQSDFAVNSLIAITSRETLPAMRRLLAKIRTIFLEKRNLAMTSILSESSRGMFPGDSNLKARLDYPLDEDIYPLGYFLYKTLRCLPVGKVTLRGADAEIHLLNGNLYDSEFISISMTSYLLNLVKLHNILDVGKYQVSQR